MAVAHPVSSNRRRAARAGAWPRGRAFVNWLVFAWAALCLSVAQAQTIDDVQLLTQNDDVVARVTFNATVRFLQQTPPSATTLYQITWELVAGDEAILNQATGESKRVAGSAGVPEFTLNYAGGKGRGMKTITLQLATAAPITVRQGPSSHAIDIVFTGAAPHPAEAAAPVPAAPAEPAVPSDANAAPAAPAVVAAPEIEARAAELMQRARDSLAARHNEDAIANLNQLLLLPPNSLSQQAQELVGLAWERAGDAARARTEYELYLRLYPQGEGAARVGQRLASLEGGAAPPPGAASGAEGTAATKPSARGGRFTGSIAQYYYGGKARTQTLVTIAQGIDQSTLSRDTESAIVTSLDAGARYDGEDSETRLVLRGTNSINLSAKSHNQSLLSAAYVDYRRKDTGLALRVGRQSAIGGGLLGLFDGASLTYPLNTTWKVDVMGGVPSNSLVSAPQERLYAAMVEADGLLEHWGGDAYLIDQTTQGITNRRALGAEVRYSGDVYSSYSLLDYDLLFHKVNAVSLQGSWQAPAQTTFTLLLDSRKAPSLELTNALISAGVATLRDLLLQQTEAQVRADALATTAQARQGLLSMSRPLNPKWQLSLDLRYSSIGATPAVGNFDATPATGAQYGSTLQLTGSNLYSLRDINNFNISLLHAPTFKGGQFSYSNLTGMHGEDMTLEPSITFYTQRDSDGIRLNRTSGGLRVNYRLTKRANLLGEGLVEHSVTDGPANHGTTTSLFFYFGYRYDLF